MLRARRDTLLRLSVLGGALLAVLVVGLVAIFVDPLGGLASRRGLGPVRSTVPFPLPLPGPVAASTA